MITGPKTYVMVVAGSEGEIHRAGTGTRTESRKLTKKGPPVFYSVIANGKPELKKKGE
jgi:hypothetical protein